MIIDESKIREEYGSIRKFCKKHNIGIGVYNGVKRKETDIFQEGKSSFKVYKKLKRMGLILGIKEVA